MSDISANIIVQPFDINISVENPPLTITPEIINLTVVASGGTTGSAGGGVYQLQYNNGSGFGGIPTATYSNGNLALGNVANLQILGGTNGYVLQTDGTGNLGWTAMTGGGGNGAPGGANTQIQFNDGGLFGGVANLTFDKTTNVMTLTGNLIASNANLGNLATANFFNGNGTGLSSLTGANVTGQVPYAGTANSVAGANVSGEVAFAAVANSVAVANVSGIGNIATINLTGSTSNVLYGNGTFAPITNIANANFANFAGNVTNSAQPNITSVGTLTALATSSNNVTLANGASATGNSIAIGTQSFANAPSPSGYDSVAIGNSAYAGNGAIAIGNFAGKFVSNIAANATGGIAIGHAAGWGNARGANSIVIGTGSGANAKAESIVIGAGAGQSIGINSIIIGHEAAPSANVANVIVLNATGSGFNPAASSRFYVTPVRNADGNTIVQYNSSTGEISHSDTITANLVQIENAGAIVPITSGNGNIGFSSQRWGNIFGVNANITTIVSNAVTSNNVTFNQTINGNVTPNVATSTTVTHKIPIVLNGVTYYMCLTDTP